MHHYKVLLILTMLLAAQNAEENINNLRQRVYLMEKLFRNDVDAIRQTLQQETNERKIFLESVTAFMQFFNTTLQQGSETKLNDDFIVNTRLQIINMGSAISSLKRIYKDTNKTVEDLLDHIQDVTDSLKAVTKTVSQVDDTCKRIYSFLCSCDDLYWKKKDLQCYKRFDDKKSWSDAKAHCQKLNGDLAVVEDQETNDFIAAGMTDFEYFLDGTDAGHEGRWIWNSTGEEIQFNHWLDGQPDNYYESEHCLAMRGNYYDNAWNDMPCYMELPFVCQSPCRLV